MLPFIGGPLGARMAPVADTDGEVRLATLEITGDYAWMSGMVTAVVRDGVLVVGARARLIRDSRVIAEDLRVATLLCENPELEFVTRLKAGGEGQVGCVLSLGCAQAIAGDVAETYIRLARGDRVDGDRLSVPGYGHDPLREEALGTAEIKDVIRGSGVTIARPSRCRESCAATPAPASSGTGRWSPKPCAFTTARVASGLRSPGRPSRSPTVRSSPIRARTETC